MRDEPLITICSGKNRSALRLAEKAHRGVTRKADRDVPYILHPVAVADVLAGAGASRNLICAGCLHDTVEDTDVTIDQIQDEFGGEVAGLVAAVTKPADMKQTPLDEQADRILGLLLNAARTDTGVPLALQACALKAADLLVNMTDLVLDAEQHGPGTFAEIFGAGRAQLKIGHYLRLGGLLTEQLSGTSFEPLGRALTDRAGELQALAAKTG